MWTPSTNKLPHRLTHMRGVGLYTAYTTHARTLWRYPLRRVWLLSATLCNVALWKLSVCIQKVVYTPKQTSVYPFSTPCTHTPTPTPPLPYFPLIHTSSLSYLHSHPSIFTCLHQLKLFLLLPPSTSSLYPPSPLTLPPQPLTHSPHTPSPTPNTPPAPLILPSHSLPNPSHSLLNPSHSPRPSHSPTTPSLPLPSHSLTFSPIPLLSHSHSPPI